MWVQPTGIISFFFEALKSLLRKTGAEVNFVRLAKKRVNLSEAKTALEKADAVFLSGGEVEDGMRWLEHHGLIGFLNELRNRGKLFFGMSAGSIMMGTHWVRWEDENDDATASLFECLGFASTIFDTHAEEEDWKELKAALKLRGPGAQGYGISAGGLVRVDSQGQMTVLEKTLIPYENVGGRVRKV